VRDIFFFVLVYLYLIVILFFVGYLNFFVSMGFLSIYIIYVILVVIQAKGTKEDNEKNIEDAHLNMDAQDFLRAATRCRVATGAKHTSMKAVDAEYRRMVAKREEGLGVDDDTDEELAEDLDEAL